MKIKGIVAKIYPEKSFENLKGNWRMLDVVLRNDENVTYKDGSIGVIREFIAIRVRGERIDDFLNQVREGSVIEAHVRFNCEEKISQKGSMYLQNDLVFACPEWKVVAF